MKPFDLNDEQLYWFLRGMKTAYEAGNGMNSAYQVSIKTVRLTNCIKVIFEYTYGEKFNGESNPTLQNTKYFEATQDFNILITDTFLTLNDKVLEALDSITSVSYDYGD